MSRLRDHTECRGLCLQSHDILSLAANFISKNSKIATSSFREYKIV